MKTPFVVVCLLAACSSNETQAPTIGDALGGATSSASGGATTNTPASGGASPSVDLTAGRAATGQGGSGGAIPPAESTPDGLLPITNDTATALKDPAAACRGWAAEPEGGPPPVLEFVIDVSGSMADQPAYPGQANSATKWQETQRVLPGVFQALPASWAIGISFYRKPDNGCFMGDQSVTIDALSDAQKSSISASIAARGPKNNTTAANNVQGATPTLPAWRFGLEQLKAFNNPTFSNSPRYIVLITDGVPTVNADGCTYVNPITQSEYDSQVDIVSNEGSSANAKTFVVGVLGSEQTGNATYDPRYMLSRLAVAGRTEQPGGCTPMSGNVDTSVTPSVVTQPGSYCHYDLSASTDFGGDLAKALGKIVSSVVSCNYSVPAPPSGNQTIESVAHQRRLQRRQQQLLLGTAKHQRELHQGLALYRLHQQRHSNLRRDLQALAEQPQSGPEPRLRMQNGRAARALIFPKIGRLTAAHLRKVP
ncbi:MAG: vWA domain-containing protein [Polyangiaceae bacterium]